MKTWQKIAIGAGAVALVGGGIWIGIWQFNKGVVTVQTGPVTRQDLTSVVTASGEIKPLTYTNVLGEGIGKVAGINENTILGDGNVSLILDVTGLIDSSTQAPN